MIEMAIACWIGLGLLTSIHAGDPSIFFGFASPLLGFCIAEATKKLEINETSTRERN